MYSASMAADYYSNALAEHLVQRTGIVFVRMQIWRDLIGFQNLVYSTSHFMI